MKANGTDGWADLAILRVGFFMEKSVEDDIVFISIFRIGKERGFKCDADVNLNMGVEAERLTLSHGIRRSHFDDQDQMREFVESCQTDLLHQLTEKNPKVRTAQGKRPGFN